MTKPEAIAFGTEVARYRPMVLEDPMTPDNIDSLAEIAAGSSGEAAGVLPDGTLQLRTDAGLRSVISGDVSVRPIHMALPPAAV